MSVIGFDVETTKAPSLYPWMPNSYLVSASTVNLDTGEKNSWLFNHPEMQQAQLQSIEEFKEVILSAKRLVAHNVKFDLLWLLYLGIDIDMFNVYCSQVAEYLIQGQATNRGQLTLADLSKQYEITDKIDVVKSFWESGYETDEIPARILVPYCEQDVINCLTLYQKQTPQIVRLGLQSLCTLQFEMSKVLAKIEYNGLLVNKEKLKEFDYEYGTKIADLDKRLEELVRLKAGVGEHDFNISSNEQLSAILYGGCIRQPSQETVQRIRKDGSVREYSRKCEILIRISGMGFLGEDRIATSKEGVFKTDMETLKSLKCKESHQREFINLILERSRLAKLKSTYFAGLLEKVVGDYIHPNMNQCVTRTGRLSSSNPNGTNFPRGSTGPVKQNFISRYL